MLAFMESSGTSEHPGIWESLRALVRRRRKPPHDAATQPTPVSMPEDREAQWEAFVQAHSAPLLEIQPGIHLQLHHDSMLSYYIYVAHYEIAERHFVNRFLEPGDVFVDVGAHCGLFSVIASELVGSQGAVIAFEPVALAHQRLLHNVRMGRCENVQCHRMALSDVGGVAEMAISLDGFDAWNSLGSRTAGEKLGRETIVVGTWDEFAAENSIAARAVLMKVDIEGWESHFLRGAQKSLIATSAPTLLMEFNRGADGELSGDTLKVVDQLTQLGYGIFRYDSATAALLPQDPRDATSPRNLIACKDAERAMTRLGRNAAPAWIR